MTTLAASPDGDQNRATELIAVTWVWCSLSLMAICLRLYSRVRITKNLWWDDWVIFFTMVCETERKTKIIKNPDIED